MKANRLIASIMLVVTTCACAKQASEPSPAAGSEKDTVGTSSIYVDGKCHFRVHEKTGQRYSNGMYRFYPTANRTVGWAFGFGCKSGISQDDIYDQIGAKPESGKWIDLDFNEPFKPKQKFKLIKFSGKNWEGIATAVDQIYYAEPDQRSRFFNFCLIENDGPQVLCGRTQIRGVTQPPSVSKLPKIMAVLKTLVFVDPPNTSPPSPATTNKP